MNKELTERKNVPKEVYKIIVKRLEKQLPSLKSRHGIVTDEVIHQARKQFKQIRALLRLMRNELGEQTFQEENTTFRDAGRPLSEVRDAKVMIDTLDELLKHFAGRLSEAMVRPLRSALQERRREIRHRVLQVDHATAHVRDAIQAAKGRANQWPRRHKRWRAVASPLEQSYRQARREMRRGFERGDDEELHESRKRSKALRYQLELLRPIWPELVGPMAEQAKQVGTAPD
jgi:CHAD domain-containing protein